jgi:hypothetical protein
MRWLLGGLLALVLASPASAEFRCKTWDKLDDAQKREALLAEIDAVLTGNVAQQYQVNKVQIRKCLQQRVPAMRDQFDGICMEGKRAPMSALDREFEKHLFTCVGRRR